MYKSAIFFLIVCTAAFSEGRPSAAWIFDKTHPRLIRDLAGGGHHALIIGDVVFDKGLSGQAVRLDGKASHLRVPNHPELVAKDAVTIDAWIWMEKPESGRPQVVAEKGGERYRLQITESGRAYFGLKGGKERGDLSGGRLKPKTWHRITGVFQRPRMELYLDGRKTASRDWDHDIGPGGDLIIGAKAGVTYFFDGRIDSLRIYRYARLPRPGDHLLFKEKDVPVNPAKLSVQKRDGSVIVNTGVLSFELETRTTGAIRWLKIGEKHLVRDNNQAPFFGSLFESETYDGFADAASGSLVGGQFRLLNASTREDGAHFQATLNGVLVFTKADTIRVDWKVTARAGSRHLGIQMVLKQEGDFQDRFLRELGMRLPLSLNLRKRIIQGGDRGVQWDTRYSYQFHAGTVGEFLTDPDHNEWRIFAVEQDSRNHYRIWRSESESTSALTMQEGIRAPGWMAAYDEQGGALFAYRDVAASAPKVLQVLGAGGAESRILFHSSTQPAASFQDDHAASRLFNVEHQTDWIFFADDYVFAQPDVELAKVWGAQSLESAPPARPEIPLKSLKLLDAPPAEESLAPFVNGGVPLPRGAIDAPDQVRLFRGGAEVPLQTRPLAFWPDGSIKWLLLTFPLDGSGGLNLEPGKGDGDRLAFDVSLRSGKRERFELRYGKRTRMGSPGGPMKAVQSGSSVTIDTGPLQIETQLGEQWLKTITFHGRQMLASGKRAPIGSVDFLRPAENYPVGTTHPSGQDDPGPVIIESVRLEESGPLRCVVRLEGKSASKEPARIILRVEAYAGKPYVRMFHTVEFLHKDPRRAFVRRMALSLPLAVDSAKAKVIAGSQTGPEKMKSSARTGLRQLSHLHYELWQQGAGKRYRTRIEEKHRSRGWLSLSDGQSGALVAIRNIWQEYPKEILAETVTPALTAYLWPESSPLMDVRRYSNFPHRSQGESTSDRNTWVEQNYYPNDPFVGVSKTHELLWLFHDADVPGTQLDAAVADFQSPPLVYAGADWYAKTGVTFPFRAPDAKKFPAADANLEHLANFWLFHQKLWGWYGLWNYGDFQHLFQSGYGWVYAPEDLAELLTLPADERKTRSKKVPRHKDYVPNHDWAFDNGRWGWTNSEGLPGLFLQLEYLRTGRRDIFFAAEAMARHVRDVDIRHAGRWLGRGTRHGVQHWSDGDHEERQTTHTEFRFHHYLTGDMRSRDVAEHLTREVYTKGRIWIHAAHSGRLYGLLTRWEMTGDKRLGRMLRDYVHCFIVPEGLSVSPPVEFPQVKLYGKPGDINNGTMFFRNFGAMHALIEYYELTHDEKLRDALVRLADHTMNAPRAPEPFRKAVAFAARYAPNPEPYRKLIRKYVRDNVWAYYNQVVSSRPEHWTGRTAFLNGNVPGSWFWINDMFYLMTVLDSDPELSESTAGYIRNRDEQGRPSAGAALRWQSEYDREELQEYLQVPR